MSEIATGATGAWSYRAGSWFAVFGSKVTILLPESQKDQVVSLWSLVDGGAGFDEVLDGLLASGLSRIPGFVLVSTDDGPTRILLRGQGVTASLTGAGEDVALDGAASHTWVERAVEGVTALTVTVPGDADDDSADFPILGGLVRVGRIDRPAAQAPSTGSAMTDAAEDVPMVAAVDGHADDSPVETPEEMAEEDMVAEGGPVDGGPVDDADGDSLAGGLVAGGLVAGGLVAGGAAPDVEAPWEPPPPPSFGGAHLAAEPETTMEPADADLDDASVEGDVMDESLADAAMAEEAVGDDAMDSAMDSETDSAAQDVGAEASPFDEGPATEVMDPVAGNPLTDPLTDPLADPLSDPLGEVPPSLDVPVEAPADAPDHAAPDGWVTPWDNPAPSDAPAAPPAAVEPDPLAEPDTPAIPPPPFPPLGGATEVAPPGWTPPPPPIDAGVADAPPLPIGSWEPVGGAVPPPPGFPLEHDGLTVAGGGEPAVPPSGIPGQPQAPAITAPVATLLISDGQTIVVDRAVLIGRAPEARRFTSTEQPTLVTVPSRLHEISSTHVEVRPGTGADHGTAVVTDMGSTNGTVLVQPGLGPEDLKPGIAVQLIPGAIINLGDGVTIQVTRP
jgi:hypothetical protein